MPRLRLVLALSLPLSCGPDTGDDDGETTSPQTTTDATVTTTASTSSPTTTASEPTTGAPTADATTDPATTDPATTDPAATDPATTTGDFTSSTTSGDDTTGATTADDTDTTGAVAEELPPIDSVDALETWLAGGAYKQWAVESQVHPSSGPHAGNVRTYVNAIALQSLADGNLEHPQDAATVKELYGGGFDEIIGYAVSLKTAPLSEAGATWYWYERIQNTTYGGELGTPLCTGCHGGGADYILTPYPLQ
jgi:hypothetical protein